MHILTQPDTLQTYPVQTYPADSSSAILRHMSSALHASVDRVLALLISILPGLLAFIIALVVLTAIGMFLSFILRRALTALRFDDRLSQTTGAAVSEWSPSHSPTALAGRVTFWACVLLGLIIGISAFDVSYESGSTLSISLLPYLTHSVGAILLLFAGNLIARFLARTVLIGAVNNQLQYARFLSMGVKWLVLVLTGAMVLDHLGIGGTIVALAFGILFGGIVLTLALAVGLGSRDLVSRSLERNVDKTADRAPDRNPFPPVNPVAEPREALRHF